MHAEELLRRLLPSLDVGLLAEAGQLMRQRGDEETPSCTRGVEDGLALLRIEHFDGEPHYASGREVLASVTAKVHADEFLVCDAFGVHVGACEVILGQLGDNEGESAVGQVDRLVALEDALVLLYDLSEQFV